MPKFLLPARSGRWHGGSEFGPGPRRPLDNRSRAAFYRRLDMERRAGRITLHHEQVGRALCRRLGQDGQLNPSHRTLADDTRISLSTVKRALDLLRDIGLVKWVRRLVRNGWRTEQTSNGYELLVDAPITAIPLPRLRSSRWKRGTLNIISKDQRAAETAPASVADAARKALEEIGKARSAALDREWLERRRAQAASTPPART